MSLIKTWFSNNFENFKQPKGNADSSQCKVTHIKSAMAIATASLRERYSKYGIQAGCTHFSDVWIRDCCFAGFGSLSLGDIQPIKDAIETFIQYMKPDGQIPLRVGQKFFLLKFLGLSKLFSKKGPSGVYIEDKYVSTPTDSNSLFLVLLGRYADTTHDLEYVRRTYSAAKKALAWNVNQSTDTHLISEGHYASWADSIRKKGTVLYTNVLFYKSLTWMTYLADLMDDKDGVQLYTKLAEKLRASINMVFWNGSYYIDWIGPYAKGHFSTDGNALAIIAGIPTYEQSQTIQAYIQKNQIDHSFCIDSVYPPYDKKHVYTPFFLIQLQDYHNGLKWLWLGCIDAVAKYRIGLKDQAVKNLYKMAERIVEHGGVYEVYEKTGDPVKRLFYQSEKGFAWSSGLFVWACHECGVV